MGKDKENKERKLPIKQRLFCQEYIIDWNGTRAYKTVYKGAKNDNVAGVEAHKLLRKPKIQDYIKEIQDNLEEQAGISKLKMILELTKVIDSDSEDSKEKIKAIAEVNKMLGYNSTIKTDVTTNGESLNSGLSDEELDEKIRKLSGKKG